MTRRRLPLVAVFVFICICAYSAFRISSPLAATPRHNAERSMVPGGQQPLQTQAAKHIPEQNHNPKPVPAAGQHPIEYLTSSAQKEFEDTKRRQSSTLREAVQEYRRRYGIPPPPHFDKWFEFAKSNGVQLIDEFDTIHDVMTPFWGLKPKTIRARAKEALGFENAMIGVAIRDHKVSHMQGGKLWQRNATSGMMSKFLEYLPDMDLVFNGHDEPRVMLPHEDLARLVTKAKTQTMLAAGAIKNPVNDFSARAPELAGGTKFEETKLSRFNNLFQQATWTHSRMSCSPDSPARALEEDEATDDLSQYSMSDLGFVSNLTAMSDICNTPSLRSTYGFFDRPNTYTVVQDLFPIFSQSKISSYVDILYPSPWYWSEQVEYNEKKDTPWAEKQSKFFWRGSNTGGFSRFGGWRRQHRQQIIQTLNAVDSTKVMAATDSGWEVKEVPRGDFRDVVDAHFTYIGQCSGGDCEAQSQFFHIKPPIDQQDAWGYKHLLDMDGNAFSGRFHAFLRSRSLTYKFAIFREWHGEWIKPWAHFIPLSLQGNEWLEAIRYFRDGEKGDAEAERVAEASREWANKALRKEDMEAWFFRLLLEYARVIDDNREVIGFDPSSAGKKLEHASG